MTIRCLAQSVTLFMLACGAASAAALSVTVHDKTGMPVRDVVVVARSTAAAEKALAETTPTVMDQINRQFAPYVVAVHTGTSVLFANSDSVAHQVYSFSPTRQFELGLYRGKPRSPILFDKPGIVVLGCNIHDNMIGYVYVTDAPHFGTTDAQGHVRFADLMAGEFAIELWSPRQSADEPTLRQTVTLPPERSAEIDFRFRQTLAAEPAPVREQRLRDY